MSESQVAVLRVAEVAKKKPPKDRLTDQAYAQLKRDIITQRFAPGEKISEGRLVELTGMTRAPIRSAISQLHFEGLIIQLSSKTQIVTPLTIEGCQQIFHLRNLLEPDAARQAAGQIDIDALLVLNQSCARDYTPGNRDEEYALLQANRDFHLAIARGARNDIQVQFIERLQDAAMRALWLLLRLENKAQEWSTGHEEIIEALASADAKKAEKAARIHLEHGQKAIYDVLLQSVGVKNINISPGLP